MSNKLDIFEILGKNETENQEQHYAPDFDLLNVEELMGAEQPAVPEPIERELPAEEVQEPVKATASPVTVKKKTSRISKKAVLGILKIAVAVIAVVVFVTMAMTTVRVSDTSMDPVISEGDRIVVNKFTKSYSTGDVVLFRTDAGEKYTARIVAKGGDVVNITKNGKLFVNNNEQSGYTPLNDVSVVFPVIIDEETFFVLGDNRENAVDSRNATVGLLDEEDIIGKVVYCFKKL